MVSETLQTWKNQGINSVVSEMLENLGTLNQFILRQEIIAKSDALEGTKQILFMLHYDNPKCTIKWCLLSSATPYH